MLTVEFTVLAFPASASTGPGVQAREAFASGRDDDQERPTLLGRDVGMAARKAPAAGARIAGALMQITPRVLTDALAAGGDEAGAVRGDDADAEDRRRGHRGGAAGLN